MGVFFLDWSAAGEEFSDSLDGLLTSARVAASGGMRMTGLRLRRVMARGRRMLRRVRARACVFKGFSRSEDRKPIIKQGNF